MFFNFCLCTKYDGKGIVVFRCCGWFGALESGTNQNELISKTGAEFADSKKWTIFADAAVSITDFQQASSLQTTDRYIAFLGGRFQWLDKEIAKVSATTSAANALTIAYQKYKEKLFDILHGHYSLAIFDRLENCSLLATDKLGVNNLSFALHRGSLFFGTDTTSVAAMANVRDIDTQSLFNYLFFHVVPSPGSIYKGINKLPPAHYIFYKNGTAKINRYWACDFEEKFTKSRHELNKELNELLRNAVKHCMVDDKTGAFLSGGIDSSTVTGILSEYTKNSTNTYTIGFDAEGYDETSYARTTADHFKTLYHEYKVTRQDVVDIIPKISEFYDEPFGNSSAVPVYYCAHIAKSNGMNSMLAGDGGDELFAGNYRYVREKIFHLYERIPSFLRQNIVEPLVFNLPGRAYIPLLRKAQNYINHAKIPMPDRLEAYNFLSKSPIADILHSDFLETIDSTVPYALLRDTYDTPNTESMLNKMLYLDWKFTLADNDLRKVNGMCHMAGIDVQYPLLDDELLLFSARLPADMKIEHFKLRSFFKNAMKGYLPDRVLTKSKHGFGLPFGVWMKEYTPMKELAYDSLFGLKKRNIVKSGYVDQLIDMHQSEHSHYYGEFIWVLMMLELWLSAHTNV